MLRTRRMFSRIVSLVLCAGMALPLAAAPQPKTLVVLVDLSDSAEGFKREYIEDFRIILDHVNAGDVLLVTRIVKHPSAADALPIRVSIDAGSWIDNPKQGQQQRLLKLTKALMDFEALLRETEDATPIVAVMEKVPRWLQSFPNPRKLVVVMSDMREYSPATANFESRSGWTPAALDAFLARLRKDALLPDLSGVRIYVSGARDKDEARLRAVRGFWQRYFETTKADFAANRYDTRLVRFDECNDASMCQSRFFRDRREEPVRKFLEQKAR